MNKYIWIILSILVIAVISLSFLLKNEIQQSNNLQNQLEIKTIEISNLRAFNQQKDEQIKAAQKKYNEIVENYKGTECENMKVSQEMIEALRSLR